MTIDDLIDGKHECALIEAYSTSCPMERLRRDVNANVGKHEGMLKVEEHVNLCLPSKQCWLKEV